MLINRSNNDSGSTNGGSDIWSCQHMLAGRSKRDTATTATTTTTKATQPITTTTITTTTTPPPTITTTTTTTRTPPATTKTTRKVRLTNQVLEEFKQQIMLHCDKRALNRNYN